MALKSRILFILYSPNETFAEKKMKEMSKYKHAEDVTVILCTPDNWQQALDGHTADTIHFQQLVPPTGVEVGNYFNELENIRKQIEFMKTHNI